MGHCSSKRKVRETVTPVVPIRKRSQPSIVLLHLENNLMYKRRKSSTSVASTPISGTADVDRFSSLPLAK